MTPRSIILEQVCKSFGRQIALQNVDLAFAPGECVGLVGHNGAGKSTLIKLMLGLSRPDSGRVSVLGEDPAGRAGARTRWVVGYLAENVALYPALTGVETIEFYARLKGIRRADALTLLSRVGLAAEARLRTVRTYSKGMRQRLALAQAMLGAPRVLLLDEPTSGLDPGLRQSFYEILHELREGGATILLSSHQLTELEGAVDRVIVMAHGRKMADGDMLHLRRLAGVAPLLRIRLDQAARPLPAGWHSAAGGSLELTCAEEEIAGRLRALPDGVVSVEILRPSLDDIYATFLRQPETAAREGGG